jgi:Mce-associated membrane protein
VTSLVAGLRPRASRPAAVLVALVVVVTALAVATGVLFAKWQSARAAGSARTAAVAAAKQKVPALLSYAYQTFATDLARAEADTTPQFRATYGKLMTGHVEPTAMQDHVVTQASVSASSVVDSGPGTVTLLMFLSQQTKTDAKQESVLNDTAVQVTMSDVNGTWLVSGLTPKS